MPRQARLYYPGGVFHLVSRFSADKWYLDRSGARAAYLGALEHALSGTDARCLAYCLMSNHVHLVVVQGKEPLSRLTKSVHTSFSQWVRRGGRGRKKALGPVFAERPFGRLVQKDAYLSHLVRYVHCNPVRAGVVRRARFSDWSSHRAYLGLAIAPEWLHTGFVLSLFGKRASTMAKRFDTFVGEGRGEKRRRDFSGDRGTRAAASTVRAEVGDGFRVSEGVLGDEAFAARVRRDREKITATLSSRGREMTPGRRSRPKLAEVVAAVLAYVGVELWELEQRPRARGPAQAKRLVAWVWLQQYGGQQIDLVRGFHVTSGAVSQWYRAAMQDAGAHEEAASNVVSLLGNRARHGSARKRSKAAKQVRYHVDLDE